MTGQGGEATNEARRLATLRRYAVLDTPPEEIFDRITRLTATIFDVPIALIGLIDESRQWYKSRVGLEGSEAARSVTFCDHAIRGDDVMVVPDATLDPRFSNNAFVRGEPKVRFYAGAPLSAPDGSKLGTICIIDRKPRQLDAAQRALLAELSELVMAHFELRSEMRENVEAHGELAAVIDTSPGGVVIARADGTITAWNETAARIFGYSAEEMIGKCGRLWPHEFDAQAEELGRRVIEDRESIDRLQIRGVHKSGAHLQLVLTAKPVCDSNGTVTAVAYTVENFSDTVRLARIERHRNEVLELAAGDAPIDDVLAHLVANLELAIPDSLAIISRLRGGRLFHAASSDAIPAAYVNSFEGMNVGPNEGSCGAAAHREETVVVSDIASDPLWDRYRAPALAHGLRACWSAPIHSKRNGVLGSVAVYSAFRREATLADLRFLHEAAHVAAIAIEANDARRRLEDVARTDALTDLPNRQGFELMLGFALESALRRDKKVALGMLDLNRFRVVNESLGHAAGDSLLRDIAIRLQRAMRPGDVLARLSSDEFLFLLTDLDDVAAADRISRRFLATLDRSFLPDGHEIFVRASVGIAMYPDDARETSQLLRLAESAMRDAKTGGEGIVFYRAKPRRDRPDRLELETDLNRALDKGEFVLNYQPLIDLTDGSVAGAEALIRWNHPKRGLLMPETFVRLAEETGLIVPIGAWVVREACRFGWRWREVRGSGSVSVNVSPRQFETRGLVEMVKAELSDSGLPPENLCLEITESLVMASPAGSGAAVAGLRALGVRCVIDDFGAGYSSLSHLRHFPIDGLKIDRSFVSSVGDERERDIDHAIVRAILSMGRAAKLAVVAEGVETEAQRRFLLRNHCRYAQGYFFSPPMPENEMLGWSPGLGSGKA